MGNPLITSTMKKTLSALFLTSSLWLLASCGGDPTPTAADTASSTDDGLLLPDTASTDTTSQDAQTPVEDVTETPPLSGSWCASVIAPLKGERAFAQDFARAHVGIRLFGPSADWIQIDAQLSSLLNEVAMDATLLETYATKSDEICSVDVVTPSEAPLSITLEGDIAVVVPGTGSLELPDEVNRVLLDLRDPESLSHLRSTLQALLPQSVGLGSQKQRRFHGFPSQSEGWTHFEVSQQSVDLVLEGTGSKDRVLAVFTGPQLTPDASLVIGGLRMANELSIMGHDLHSAVAESTSSGIGASALVWRSAILSHNGSPWPDRIPADFDVTTLEEAISALAGITNTPSVVGAVDRSLLEAYDREAGTISDELKRGTMKSSLLVAYGTLDLFYPYFDVVGRGLDDALLAALEEVELLSDGDRVAFRTALGRFMHHIHDGHGFYTDYAREDWWDGYLAIQIQRVANEAVVRTSAHPGINPGDTIVKIDGQDSASWFDETMSTVSASSSGYAFVQAADKLKEVYGTRTLTLRDPQGVERTETFQPEPYETMEQVAWGGTMRESGWLNDLDAPGIFYVNMAASVTPDESPIVAQMAEIKAQASGMILDMRDYPYLHIYEFARNFHTNPFTAPIFTFPTWEGAEDFQWTEEIWDFLPADQVYTGPIALLVSNKSVSAAECFAQMIMDLDNVTVVGQQSASTNGTITDVRLPGNFQITFTGMLLLSPDGSPFHGIGVVPDEEVVPTAEDFEAGTDPELSRAIEVLIEQSP